MNLIRAIALAIVIGLFGSACGVSTPANRESNSRETRDGNALRWEVISTTSPRTLKVGGVVGYCVGDPQPIIERPQIRYRDDDVYIRLEVQAPRKKRKGRLCGSTERFVAKKITLPLDLSEIQIYDSGIKPPELRWP